MRTARRSLKKKATPCQNTPLWWSVVVTPGGESGVLEVRGWVDIKCNELDYKLLKDCWFYIYSDEWESDGIQFRNGVLSFKELPFLINKKWNLGVKF